MEGILDVQKVESQTLQRNKVKLEFKNEMKAEEGACQSDDIFVLADKDRMQVISNLLDNTLKLTSGALYQLLVQVQAFWKRESSWVNQPLHEIMIKDCQNIVGTVSLRMNMCDYAKDVVQEGPTNRI